MIDVGLLKDAVASEWTKLRSVRSTYWTIFAAIIFGIGLSCAISAGNAHAYHSFDAHDRLFFDPTADSLSGLFFAQLAFAVLAVLTISAEYSTGLIRTTLSAVPQRGYVLAAKAIMTTITATVVSLVISFASFSLGQLIFSNYSARNILTGTVIPGKHLNASLSNAHVLRAVFGGGLYIGGLVLLALGLGTIVRHTAGGITAMVALVFVVPAVAQLLPDSWQHDFVRFLPAQAGSSIFNVVPQGANSLSPLAGYLVFLAWAAGFLAIGWYLLRTRDV